MDLTARLADCEDRLRDLEARVAGTDHMTLWASDITDDHPFGLEVPEWLREAPGAVPAADRPVDQGYDLVIGLINTATSDPCAVCGNLTDFEVGPELFLAGSEALVCWDCGRRHAPALVDLFLLSYKVYEEPRYVGETEVILNDVNRAFNLAAVGLVELHTATTRYIEAGCQVVVATRLVNSLPCTESAIDALRDTFAHLYSGRSCWPTASTVDDDPNPFL